MATNTEKIVVQIIVEGDKQLDKVTKKTKNTTAGFTKMAAGILGAAAAFRQINQLISSSIRTFRDFEFQMAKVKAITGASNKDFMKLSNSSQELGRSTFFTAQQVAELQTNFGKLGFSTKEILKAQEATLLLATATDTDLARAAIVAGAAVRGFALDASETGRVADVMAVAFTSSALDIEKFQTSMTKVAPIAAGANITLEATTAVMGTLTDAGIEASIAGTSLRNIFLKMQDPTSALSKKLGFTVNSSEDLQKALTQLNAEGMSNAEMMQLVDLRQVAAFQTMINGSQNISDLTFELEQANGAAGDMADTVGDNLEGAFKRMASAWQGFSIVVTESIFGKGLQAFIDGTAQLFNNFTDFIEEPIEETLNKDRIAMNALAMETMQLAEGTDERRLAIIQLQKQYPSYFANLDSEKTKNDELSTALELANNQYIQRIVLRKKDAEAQAVEEEAAEQFNKKREETKKAREAAVKLNEDYKLGLDLTNMSLEEARKAVTKLMVAQSDYTDDADPTLLVLTNSAKKAEVATKKYNDLTISAEDLRKEYKALKEEFKIEDDIIPDPNKDKNVGDPVNFYEEEKAALEKKLRDDLNLEKESMLEGNLDKEMFDLIEFELEQEHLQNMLDLNLKYGEDTSNIQSQILDSQLNRIATVAAAEKKKNDVAEKDRKNQIKDLDTLGKSLITMSGEEKKLQGVKKLGIKITAAATLATNLETIANAKNAITKAAGEKFPASLIAIVTVLAAMLGAAKSAQTITQFADGGMVQGKSHAQGGEKFAVGGRVVELEGGEAVINKRSTSMFRNQLSAMNSAGGGVKFADGGLMNMPSFAQSQFNAAGQAGMMGAMGQGSRVVVVESDITTSQNTVSVIEAEATI